MKSLLVTRPEPAAAGQAARLRKLGFDALVEPLIRIEFLPGVDIPLADVQALIVTSANALRAVEHNPVLPSARKLPVFAVGEATAALARKLGFKHVRAGPGDAPGLAALIAENCSVHAGALLHLAGDRVAFDMGSALAATHHQLRVVQVYRAVDAKAFSAPCRLAIETASIAGVLLMSPATADVYARLMTTAGLTSAACAMQTFCLSQAVADRIASVGCRHVNVAATPKEDDLLALVSSRLAN